MCNGGYGMTIGLCTYKTWCVMCDVYVYFTYSVRVVFAGLERV